MKLKDFTNFFCRKKKAKFTNVKLKKAIYKCLFLYVGGYFKDIDI